MPVPNGSRKATTVHPSAPRDGSGQSKRRSRFEVVTDIRVIGRSARAFSAAMYAHHDIDGPAEMAVAVGKTMAWDEERRKENWARTKEMLEHLAQHMERKS